MKKYLSSPLICALALLLSALTGAVSGLTTARLAPPAAGQFSALSAPGTTNLTHLALAGGLSTLAGPVALGGARVQLGDIALTGNGTQITLDDAQQTVELGSPDTGRVLRIEPANGALNASAFALAARLPTTVYTDTHSVAASQTGGLIASLGATAALTYTLPAAAAGLDYCFYVGAAQALTIKPASGDKIDTTAAANRKLVADAVGEYLCLAAADTTNWLPYAKAGTWTDTP